MDCLGDLQQSLVPLSYFGVKILAHSQSQAVKTNGLYKIASRLHKQSSWETIRQNAFISEEDIYFLSKFST